MRKDTQFIAAIVATLSALSMGMCLSWSSSAIPMLQTPNALYPTPVTGGQGSWIGSLITLGACAGAIPAGLIAAAVGRKRALQLAAVPLLASWLQIAAGGCVYSLYCARFLAGLAVGTISVAAPMYVAELAHKSIRGTLGTFFQVQITIGLLLEYILGGTLHDLRTLALASALVPAVFLAGLALVPETPVHLHATGRAEAARRALIFFRGRDFPVEEELKRIAEDAKAASANRATVAELVRDCAARRGLVVSLGLMAFQQLSGINAVLFYANFIFSETGSALSPDACAVLVGGVQVLATLLSTILIDKTGRKFLLFVSAFIMCICLLSLGLYFHFRLHFDLSDLSILPLISLAVYIVVFSIGFGPIPWMMMGEIFPPRTRGPASAVSAAANWTLAFTVTNQFQHMAQLLGIGGTFGLFGLVCGLAAVFVAVLVPETKNKTVEEVRVALAGGECEKLAPV